MLEGLKSELRRPGTAIAALFAIFGILAGAITAVYFYYLSVREGKFSYQVEQFQVFDQSTLGTNSGDPSSSLFIVDRDGNKINSNVYAARIKIWNSGTDEIKRENVRIPFSVNLSGSNSIVSISIEGVTRNNIDRFAVDRAGLISWVHFDPQEGFIIRLVYSAKSYSNVLINGFAVNSTGPTDTKTDRTVNEENFAKFIVGLLLLAVLVIVTRMVILFLQLRKDDRRSMSAAIGSFLFKCLMIGCVSLSSVPLINLLIKTFGWSFNPTPPL